MEAEFLGSAACGQLVAAGIPVARAHAVQREICRSDRGTLMTPLPSTLTLLSLLVSRSEPIDSRFALLLEDFSPAGGWRQHRLLGPAAARVSHIKQHTTRVWECYYLYTVDLLCNKNFLMLTFINA